MPQVLHTGKARRVCGPIAAQAVSVVTGAHSREPEACLKTRPGSRSRQLFENMETFLASAPIQPATPQICMTPRAEEPIFICPPSCYDHTRRSLTGARIETSSGAGTTCGSSSLPHGSADRNDQRPPPLVFLIVAPSRERGSKHAVKAGNPAWADVAPSRERGSKQLTHIVRQIR